MNTSIVVYLGPSLTEATAKKYLPDALYLPPAKCGDIIAAIRLQPKAIIIIDGNFETVAAVRHKEILFALSKGIIVLGAASMGALRAAELADQGMIGVGDIFHAYYTGIIEDDDEVAVFHSDAVHDYQVLSDALVNIRATLNAAYEEDVLNFTEYEQLLSIAKATHFSKRQLRVIIHQSVISANTKANFLAWFNAGNYRDQKQQDAILALQQVHINMAQPIVQANVQFNTSYFRALHTYVMCNAFPARHTDLPTREIYLQQNTLTPDYLAIKKMAYLMAAIPESEKHVQHFLEENHDNFSLQRLVFFYPDADFIFINNLVTSLEKFKSFYPERFKIHYICGCLWEKAASIIDLQANAEQVTQFKNYFYALQKIDSSTALDTWLQDKGLTTENLQRILLELTHFDYIITKHNYDVMRHFNENFEKCWLTIAQDFLEL